MNKQKLILFGAIGGVLLIIFFIFSLIGGGGNKSKVIAPKEFNVWVVGDETAGYSDIITAFKTRYPDYANTDIKFTKFSNYSDYEKTLLNVMSDGNSPDIFVVNNNSINSEGNGLLENKIVGLPDSVVNQDYFEKNFNKIFDELVIQSTEKDSEGKDKKVNYLKGVPMGYEALGVFYNFRKVRNIPTTWSELDKEIIDSAKEDYSTIGIGYGNKYIQNPTDILTLIFLQNGVKDYKGINSPTAESSLKAYIAYATDINNGLSRFTDEMNTLNLTTTDLFVRGKVGMIIGYPSLIKEIILSIKRTAGESNLSEKFLRTAPIFQLGATDDTTNNDTKTDKTNLVTYNFFALSKFSQSSELGFKFLNFLSTKDAQQKYLDNFSYYLPALKSLEDDRLTQPIEKGFDRTKFSDFVPNDVSLNSFYKGLRNEYDSYFNNGLNTVTDTKQFLDKAFSYMDCSVNHIIKGTDFDKQCE